MIYNDANDSPQLREAKRQFLADIGADWSQLHEYSEVDFTAGWAAGRGEQKARIVQLEKELAEARKGHMDWKGM